MAHRQDGSFAPPQQQQPVTTIQSTDGTAAVSQDAEGRVTSLEASSSDADAVHFNSTNDSLPERYLDVPTNDAGPSGFGQNYTDTTGAGIQLNATAPGLKFALVKLGDTNGQIVLFASEEVFMHGNGGPTLLLGGASGTKAVFRLFSSSTPFQIVDSDGSTVLFEMTGT